MLLEAVAPHMLMPHTLVIVIPICLIMIDMQLLSPTHIQDGHVLVCQPHHHFQIPLTHPHQVEQDIITALYTHQLHQPTLQ